MEITICNHCNNKISIEKSSLPAIESKRIGDVGKSLNIILSYYVCPLCGEISLYMNSKTDHEYIPVFSDKDINFLGAPIKDLLIYPKFKKIKQLSKHIPKNYLQDYKECVNVLEISPKACAVLCRRLCEILLRDEAKCEKYRLESKIDEFLTKHNPTSPLSDFLPYLKLAGDSTAHNKEDISGIVIEVDEQDCLILIETIELLFDFLFVQPKIKAEKLQKIKKFDSSKTIKN